MHTRSTLALLTLLTLTLAACSSAPAPMAPAPADAMADAPKASEVTKDSPTVMPETAPSSQATSTPAGDSLIPPHDAIAARATQGVARLKAQGDAGAMVLASIDYHGGLINWLDKGALTYHFQYGDLKGIKPARDTWQAIDIWSSRARHQLMSDRSIEFGWDGHEAWSTADLSDKGGNPRFWSLTPYYFIAVPFVMADPGVKVATAGQGSLEDKTYDLVKVTFEAGTGDAPDDYYILYLDTETRRMGAVRYVVSYKGFFPEGGHTPEKIMIYDGENEVDGIKFAKSLRSYKWDAEAQKLGEKATQNVFDQVKFQKDLKPAFFTKPEGAMVQEKM